MRRLVIALLLVLFCFAERNSEAQTIQYVYSAVTHNITTTGGSCGDFQSSCNIIGAGAQYHQLSWNVSGTLSACSVRVDSSADGITWNTGDIIAAQTCTSNGNALSTVHTVNYTRINVTSITPVSTATLTVNLTGYANNPSGSSGGTVTSLTATSPVVATPSPITTTGAFSCPTCAIGPGSSTANHVAKFSGTDGVTLIDGGAGGTGTVTNTGGSLPNNAIVLGNTSPDIKADTGLTTNGAGAITDTTGGTAVTHTQGTITTSNPTYSHTVTWNAGGVVFSNWISNITCTAAAANSTALKLGVGGTDFQIIYSGANCATPQMLAPLGSTTNPPYSFTGDTNTGMYHQASGTISFAGAGTELLRLQNGIGVVLGANQPLVFFAGSRDVGLSRLGAGVLAAGNSNNLDTTGKFVTAGLLIEGTTFTSSGGCTEGTLVGGATAGKFTTSGSTSCSTTITMGNSATAPHGWECSAHDLTTAADVANPHLVSSTTTTVTLATGTIVSGDVISFGCQGY